MTLRISAVTLLPAVALAHPGHGASDTARWMHYLTEPVHVAILGGAVLGAIVIGAPWRRTKRREHESTYLTVRAAMAIT